MGKRYAEIENIGYTISQSINQYLFVEKKSNTLLSAFLFSVQVTGGSVASAHLQPGDVITSIGDAETARLTHGEAMQVIKECGNTLRLGVTR